MASEASLAYIKPERDKLIELFSAGRSNVVALVSGGLDSVTLAYWLHRQGVSLTLLSFDYGQRHYRELDAARRVADLIGADHEVADLRDLGRLLRGSALTEPEIDVPDGYYTDSTMKVTVVPNRNAIFLEVATGLAVARGADTVAFAAHAGDHPVYPDCRPEFVQAFNSLAQLANDGFAVPGFRVVAPFIALDKSDIVHVGAALGVPFETTWSCYRGGAVHCGRCGTCSERQEAFAVAGIPDPTSYEQPCVPAPDQGWSRAQI
jgi:7-cyano-7-deazaguanine synthase